MAVDGAFGRAGSGCRRFAIAHTAAAAFTACDALIALAQGLVLHVLCNVAPFSCAAQRERGLGKIVGVYPA
jgi:hypothetical protein